MKNTLLYCPLQYRHSLLSDTNITIALLVYQENTGEIQFFEGEKELLEIKKMYPTIKQTILNTYFEIIRKQIQKFPPERKLERDEFQTYIYHYLLPKDDASLQFGVVGTAENLNGNIKEKINFYKTLFLPQTFEGKKILQAFDAFLTQYAKGSNQILITKNGKVDKQFSICADRAWKIGGMSYFLWAADLSTQRSQQTLQIKIQEWQELLNVVHKEGDKFHFWIIPPLDDKKKEVYIKEIKTKFAPLPIEIFLPEQWVEYVKSIVQTTENSNMKKAIISYFSLADEMRKEEKLQWFRENKLQSIAFERISPDEKGNWINLADNSEWDTLLPVCSKGVKAGKGGNAIFELFSLGVVTNRDEWVYDFNEYQLHKKVNFLIDVYNKDVDAHNGKSKEEIRNEIDYAIKWTRAVKNDLSKGKKYTFDGSKIVHCLYRPFINKHLYFSRELNEMQYQTPAIFGEYSDKGNFVLNLNVNGTDIRFFCSNKLSDLHFLGDNQCLPLYRYDKNGNRQENITDWALEQFRAHYANEISLLVGTGHCPVPTNSEISKQDIFHYVYAVLHNPAYRQKYELNLKRDFPRIPFYEGTSTSLSAGFWKWAAWGKELMDLHINYETVAPYPLEIKQVALKEGQTEKAKLKADKANNSILLTDYCSLLGVPPTAWDYKLGNRSALEWILDQYKESKPSDATIAEKFNTYKFADYKEVVIDLLMRVCRVSVETVRIVGEMG